MWRASVLSLCSIQPSPVITSVKRKAAAVDVECVYWNRGRVCVGGHGGDSVSFASAQSAGLKGAPLKEVSVLSDPECSMNYILVLT